uniref:ATPase AAA-type core domain-containing protein n=1 Tax=viral metagenome TaxID=1070528 RepID=A0A6C0ERM3_9ZZZZ
MTRESNKHKLSKKDQAKFHKKDEKVKKNIGSDSDNNSSSDSEDEMDVHEYRKFLQKIFPSKHMNKKIKDGEKLKKHMEEDDSSSTEEEHIKEINTKQRKITNKKNEKHSSRRRQVSESEEEESWVTASENESEEEKIIVKKHKNNKQKNKSKGKKRSETESDTDVTLESEDSDYEEDEDEDEDDDVKPGSNKLNITLTIGRNEEEEYSDSEDDSDYVDSDEETEDEDESVSSDDDSEEDEEDDDDEEEEEEYIPKKKSKNLKNKKSISKEEDSEKSAKDEIVPNEELLTQLKSLYEQNKSNKSLKKCIEICESDIKKLNAKKEKKEKKHKAKNARIFKRIIRDKNTMNDFTFYEKLQIEEQKKIIKELREINKITRIERPYRITLLESEIPTIFKGAAMKKINSLRYMEPGSGEFYKIKNWVDAFMRIPFNKYQSLPISIEDGVDKCHDFMENAQKTLNDAVYGLNDAKMQIMQMLGQLLTNPKSIGTAIAIHGPPGTGKTSLVKEGISKILNRPFAFIALGGATDSCFLDGHSYTYEGSTWGKIVQILIDCKCMNPVIYFDELDKISDTPRGEEIAGILTHLTDTTQNSQFHDKYFSEIDFDISKCLFIFSYNDESKVNPILKDRMYRIQTKGYNQKQKTIIGNSYILPKIREQVKFANEDIVIPDSTIHYIIDNHCNKEDGVRNLKRCLEIIHTKLNLYRLMKPGSNLFEEDMSLKVEFPFTVTKDIVDKMIKRDKENFSALYTMYV